MMKLEELSNEIFLCHILPYFSLEELYQTFFGLNRRFNDILRSVRNLKFTVNETNEHHLGLQIFARGIASLTVYVGLFDLRPFSNLHCLILHYPTQGQRDAIRSENFPLLEYLRLAYPFEDRILLNLIFSNVFKHLKSCHFDRTLTDHTWSGSPKLRSLSISVQGPYGTTCILRACPNIVRLNLIVYSAPQTNVSLPRESITCKNELLQSLFLRAEFRILIGVLKCTPKLKSLVFEDITIHCAGDSSDFDLKLLADTLERLDQLIDLKCLITYFGWDRNTPWRTLHPLFRSLVFHGTSTTISSSTTPVQ